MRRYIRQRLLLAIPTLLGVSLLVFVMVHLVPGDPAQVMLGERAAPQTLAALRHEMGLDRPLPVQFGRYLLGLLRGDLGRSVRSHEQVAVELRQRFPATCELALASMLLAVALGIGAGVLAALHRGRAADQAGMALATAGLSVPIFWLGLMLVLGLAVRWPLFPVSGRLSPGLSIAPVTGLYTLDALLRGDLRAFADACWHLVLPAVTLSTVPMAVIARMTRSSLLETLGQDYIRTARAKGLPYWRVVIHHALRNASLPTLTVIALEFGYLLGGAVLTESVFAWPGVGRWLFLAVQARDFPAVQGGVLLMASVFIAANLAADVLYAWLDPRIRYDS